MIDIVVAPIELSKSQESRPRRRPCFFAAWQRATSHRNLRGLTLGGPWSPLQCVHLNLSTLCAPRAQLPDLHLWAGAVDTASHLVFPFISFQTSTLPKDWCSLMAPIKPEPPVALSRIRGQVANTKTYILDDCLKPVPPGKTGMIWTPQAENSMGPDSRAPADGHLERDPFANDGLAQNLSGLLHRSQACRSMMYRTGVYGRVSS